MSKLLATNDTFREVANLLFGDGGNELAESLIAKANPDAADLNARRIKRERTEARIGLGTNVLGLAAGGAALGTAAKDFKHAKSGDKVAPFKALKGAGKLSRISTPAKVAAGAALGLQAANVAGDVVANRVLGRAAKNPDKIKKNYKLQAIQAAEPQLQKVVKERTPEERRKAARAGAISGAGGAGFGYGLATGRGKGRLVRATALGAVGAGGTALATKNKKVMDRLSKSEEYSVKWEGEFSKVDSDKRQVFGWASIVEMNGRPVVDLQGDYISIDEVEKAAYSYVHKSRKGGDMHLRDGDQAVHKSDMIESFVVTPEKKKALGLPDDTPTGWWVGYQVNDDALWAKVKSGERTGFSIHGRGRRSDI